MHLFPAELAESADLIAEQFRVFSAKIRGGQRERMHLFPAEAAETADFIAESTDTVYGTVSIQ